MTAPRSELTERLVVAMQLTEGSGPHPSYDQMRTYAKAVLIQLKADGQLEDSERYKALEEFWNDMNQRLGLQEPVKQSIDRTRRVLGAIALKALEEAAPSEAGEVPGA